MIPIDRRAEASPVTPVPENQDNFLSGLSPYKDRVVNSVLNMASKINAGWTARLLLRGGASAAMALTPVAVGELFSSQNVPVAEAAANCSATVMAYKFLYIPNTEKNPDGRNITIESYVSPINLTQLVAPAILTYKTNPKDVKSAREDLGQNFDLKTDHYEARFDVNKPCNFTDSKGRPALYLEGGFADDMPNDYCSTGERPKTPVILYDKQVGYYFGGFTNVDTINSVVKSSALRGLDKVGNVIASSLRKDFKVKPGFTLPENNTATNLKSVKDNAAATLSIFKAIKDKEIKCATPVASSGNGGSNEETDGSKKLSAVIRDIPVIGAPIGAAEDHPYGAAGVAGGVGLLAAYRKFGPALVKIKGWRII